MRQWRYNIVGLVDDGGHFVALAQEQGASDGCTLSKQPGGVSAPEIDGPGGIAAIACW